MAVVSDSKVKAANRRAEGKAHGTGSYIPQGPLTMIGNGINRVNTGIGTGIDRVFDATLGNAVRALTNDSVDPTKWLSGEDVGMGLDILEDIGLGMVSMPLLVGKVLAQNSEGLTESILGVDAETGQDLDMKQRALKGLTGVGNVALSAVPGVGKAMKAGGKAIGKAGEESIEKVIQDLTKSNAEGLAARQEAVSTAKDALDKASQQVTDLKGKAATAGKDAVKSIEDMIAKGRESGELPTPWRTGGSAKELLALQRGDIKPYPDFADQMGTDTVGKFRDVIEGAQKKLEAPTNEIDSLRDALIKNDELWRSGAVMQPASGAPISARPGENIKNISGLLTDQEQRKLIGRVNAARDKQDMIMSNMRRDLRQLEHDALEKRVGIPAQQSADEAVQKAIEVGQKAQNQWGRAQSELAGFTPEDTSGMQKVIDALAGKGEKVQAGKTGKPDLYDRIEGRIGETADTFRESGFRDAVKTLTGRDKQTIESVAEELGDKIKNGQALTAEEQASLRNLMEVAKNGNTDAAKALNNILDHDVFDATGTATRNAVAEAETALNDLKEAFKAGGENAPTKADIDKAQKALKEAKKADRQAGNKASNVISKSMEKGGRGITREAIAGLGDTIASGLNAEANYRAENPGGSLFKDDPGLLFASILTGLLGGRRLSRNLPGMRGISQNGFGGVRSNIPYGALAASAMGTAGANRQDTSQLSPTVLNELNKMYGYNVNGEE